MTALHTPSPSQLLLVNMGRWETSEAQEYTDRKGKCSDQRPLPEGAVPSLTEIGGQTKVIVFLPSMRSNRPVQKVSAQLTMHHPLSSSMLCTSKR